MISKKATRWAAAGVVGAGLLLGGCVEVLDLLAAGNPLAAAVVYMKLLGSGGHMAKPGKKTPPVKGTLEFPLTGSIGGLSGTFSIGFDKYGSFGGTAKIGKDRKSATGKAEDSPALRQMVGTMLSEVAGADISVTKATATFKGRQTTGGVKKTWNVTINFKGTVLNGENEGKTVKGTVKSKGKL